MGNRKEIHDRVLNAVDTDDLMAAYAEWAGNYDGDLLDELGYVAPALLVQLLAAHLSDRGARVLDAGCGTGIVGELLHRAGFRDVEGLDYSAEMLAQAEKKEVYRKLFRADLTGPLDLESDTYDAVVSAGTFTCGHVGPEALRELIRITKPGGPVCFTVREQAWEEDDYAARISALERAGAWRRVEEQVADYIRDEGSRCRLCLYEVLG